MKKRNILTASALSLATIALAAGFAFNAYAQTADSASTDKTTAVKAHNNQHSERIKPENMTAAQKAAFEARRTEMEKEMAAKIAAMQTAVNSGSYDTFSQAVKTQFGENSPILKKVTADNFTQFTEAYKLMVQAQEKFKAIGLEADSGMINGLMGMGGHGGPNHETSKTTTSVSSVK